MLIKQICTLGSFLVAFIFSHSALAHPGNHAHGEHLSNGAFYAVGLLLAVLAIALLYKFNSKKIRGDKA